MSGAVRIALFVSLALNLLIVGAAIGGYASGLRVARTDAVGIVNRLPGPRAFVRALPPQERAELRRALRQAWMASRTERADARAARQAAFEAVRADPYDVEKTRAAFARMRSADQAALGVFHDRIAEMLQGLDARERRSAVEALRRAPALPPLGPAGPAEAPREDDTP